MRNGSSRGYSSHVICCWVGVEPWCHDGSRCGYAKTSMWHAWARRVKAAVATWYSSTSLALRSRTYCRLRLDNVASSLVAMPSSGSDGGRVTGPIAMVSKITGNRRSSMASVVEGNSVNPRPCTLYCKLASAWRDHTRHSAHHIRRYHEYVTDGQSYGVLGVLCTQRRTTLSACLLDGFRQLRCDPHIIRVTAFTGPHDSGPHSKAPRRTASMQSLRDAFWGTQPSLMATLDSPNSSTPAGIRRLRTWY